jgi:hypothetical protein
LDYCLNYYVNTRQTVKPANAMSRDLTIDASDPLQ